ncbi:AAA ATPase, partial [Mortierella antarctica]
MATFLRKRPMTMVFSDTEDDVVGKAWPATPTKRRSGFNQALAQIIPPPNFAACLAENSECDENTEPSSEEKLGEMLTPPMTPTRRKSTRQSTAAAAKLLPALSPSSTSDDTENSPPSTPSRRRGKSLGTLANTNNTTGLTPALNRMFKNENVLAPKKLFDQDEAKKNYLTPKRLGRTKSNIELTELPSAKEEATLEPSLVSSSSTLTTPSTSTPTTALGYYQEAKTLFRRTTEPQRLVGRAAERDTIRQFCENHMLAAKAGSLYISGQPGTGKTALLKEVMRDMHPELNAAQHDVKVVLINCMTIKDPKM